MRIKTITTNYLIEYDERVYVGLIDEKNHMLYSGLRLTVNSNLILYGTDLKAVLIKLEKFRDIGTFDVPEFLSKFHKNLFKHIRYIPDMLNLILLNAYNLGIDDKDLYKDIVKYLNNIVSSTTYDGIQSLLDRLIVNLNNKNSTLQKLTKRYNEEQKIK